ncbi:hypothetical protein NHX12_010272 [Muraenolepis orangiensis]|uniref:Uncharacterized protein n=1 Tax=Muraenolepis orangiensis TaxID=630683 RepID=A0A9Q0DMS6_9TELE|nr:hypothetical protein NHX12_010272 [Muraenolepis orangiensis]
MQPQPRTLIRASIRPKRNSALIEKLQNRPRLSIKRRPPSRRNRLSSSGEEGGVSPTSADTPLLAPSGKPGEEKPKGDERSESEYRKPLAAPAVPTERPCSA